MPIDKGRAAIYMVNNLTAALLTIHPEFAAALDEALEAELMKPDNSPEGIYAIDMMQGIIQHLRPHLPRSDD